MGDTQSYGALAPIVLYAGQIVAAAFALYALVAGRNPWSPNMPGLPNYAVRLFGTLSGIGIVALFVASKQNPPPLNFSIFALCAGAGGFVVAVIYGFLRAFLCFTCNGDKTNYVRGFQLDPRAQAVLQGKLDGLPDQYRLIAQPLPVRDTEFFCKSGKDPIHIWTRWSHSASVTILLLCYGLTMVPLIVALASGSIALGAHS